MNLSAKICDAFQLSPQLQDAVPHIDPATFIAQTRRTAHLKASPESFWKQLEEPHILLIYGSNLIETAGCDLDITWQICREVFRGNEEVAEATLDVGREDASYCADMGMLLNTGRKVTVEAIVNARREVVTHAQALVYMIDGIVLRNEDWSEELILQTHGILHNGLNENVPAGQYRNHEVAVSYGEPGSKKAKRSICMHASAVPHYMNKLVTDLNSELRTCPPGPIDPYTLAARYSHQFVMIHPFGGGDGRMSRIVLNVLLLKYAGHVAPMGHEGGNKGEYLAVVGEAGRVFAEEDMEAGFDEQVSHKGLAGFVLEKSRRSLERMRA